MIKMLVWWESVKQRLHNEKGQGMVEYALILAFVVAIGLALTNADIATAISNNIKATIAKIGA